METPGHTAGHVSVLVEQSRGALLLAGDAANLTENLNDEVAPGLCHNDDPTLAFASIRKLKEVARATGACAMAKPRPHVLSVAPALSRKSLTRTAVVAKGHLDHRGLAGPSAAISRRRRRSMT